MASLMFPSTENSWILLRVFGVVVFVAGSLFVNKKINKGDLSFMLGTVWTAAFVFGTFIAILPGVLFEISHLVGTVVPANILYFSAIFFLVVIAFGLTLKASVQNRQLIRLSQEIAIMRLRIESKS